MLEFRLQRFAGEKTERATSKRRAEVRREGRVVRSVELTSALTMLAALVGLKLTGSRIWNGWINMLSDRLSHLNQTLTVGSVVSISHQAVLSLVMLLAPFLGVVMVVGFVANYSQVGLMFRLQTLQPDFGKIQIMAGFRRLFSVRSGIETLKAIAKLLLVSLMAYLGIHGVTGRLEALARTPVQEMPGILGGIVFNLAIEIAAAMLLLGALDYVVQKVQFERSIRMSKEEVKEEHKQQEGDPRIKAEIRKRGRKMAFQRMMQEVPKADVIVTNPTHFAVALRYDRDRMVAPAVVAKGQDYVARRIREVATEHSIPLVENKPLAQALYRTVEIGDGVPAELYKAVAEVLAYVYRLKQSAVRR